MQRISDIRLAESNYYVPAKVNPQELRKVPIIEIRFKYTGRTFDRAVIPPTKDQDKDKMETDDDASEPPKADDNASKPLVADDDDEFGLPLPALPGSAPPGSAPPPADDDNEFGLPLPALPGSAPPPADDDNEFGLPLPILPGSTPSPADDDNEFGLPLPALPGSAPPKAHNDDHEFTTEDSAKFPLASAFSDMPEEGLEIRLRFRKPLVSRKVTTWYWAAACGLLVGLPNYLPQGTKEAVQDRRAWSLDQWVERYGNRGLYFPYATFWEVTEPQGDTIRRWRFKRNEL
ncbi:MAG: hypothetical protein OHK93_000075 [Ramalina farinacea]|uniref:Uncharacterized protein n=1 Tax=Ramalina farinacea TaxID=258253 RepID=A0AA43QE75_9LECA|nr:hypothetical protein [Ramalina farinacea]